VCERERERGEKETGARESEGERERRRRESRKVGGREKDGGDRGVIERVEMSKGPSTRAIWRTNRHTIPCTIWCQRCLKIHFGFKKMKFVDK
jgi:hypothetical protein